MRYYAKSFYSATNTDRNATENCQLSTAISPLDPEFSPGCNQGLQGMPDLQPSRNAVFMAHVSHMETQWKLNATVEPSTNQFPSAHDVTFNMDQPQHKPLIEKGFLKKRSRSTSNSVKSHASGYSSHHSK